MNPLTFLRTRVLRLGIAIQAYRHVKSKIRQAGQQFPPIEFRLLGWLFFESLTRGNCSYARDKKNTVKRLCQLLQRQIEQCIVQFCAYFILMVYDEAVERYNLTKIEIYDQLSRCLAGFLVGAFHGFPVSVNVVKEEMNRWSVFSKCFRS